MSLRIAHCADLHLGLPIRTLGEKGKLREKERLDVWARILKICEEKKVQVLLIAGDFLEASLSEAELEEVRDRCAAFAGTIVIAPGNHDFYAANSPYALDWSDNVHILREEQSLLHLEEEGVWIAGAAFSQSYQYKPWCLNEEQKKILKETQEPRIGLLHGEIKRAQDAAYGSIDPADWEGYVDYLALGHIHRRSEIEYLGSLAYAYSGCPDGMGFDETGEKGIYVGEVAQGEVRLDFVPLSSGYFYRFAIDVTDCTAEEITEKLRTSIIEKDKVNQSFFRIILRGVLSPAVHVDLEKWQERLRRETGCFYLELREGWNVAVSLASYREEVSLRGLIAQMLLEEKERMDALGEEAKAEKEEYAVVLRIAHRAFAGEENLLDS